MNQPPSSVQNKPAAGLSAHPDNYFAAQYQHFVEAIHDYAMFLADLDGTILSWNPGVEKIIGYTAQEWIGLNIAVLYSPEERALLRPDHDLEQLREHGVTDDNRWHLKKSGARFWAEGYIVSIRNPDTNAVYALGKIIADGTVRRESDDARNVAIEIASVREAELRDLANAAPHIMWISAAGGAVRFWNRQFYEYTSISAAAAAGTGWSRIMHPDDLARFLVVRAESFTHGTPYRYEYRLRRADGVFRWYLGRMEPIRGGDGKIQKWVGTATDIEAEVREREALRAAEEKQRRIAETLQQVLLKSPDPDTFPHLTFSLTYEPAWREASIGGDWYDVFAVDERRVAFVVGDVAGKGLGAATLALETKFILRAFLREDPRPATALERINQVIFDNIRFVGAAVEETLLAGATRYAGAICIILDTQTGEGVCACAGMESPFLAHDGVTEPIECGGTMLGVSAPLAYETRPFQMGGGDLLVVCTDGLTEAHRFAPPDGTPLTPRRMELFEMEGVRRSVEAELAADPDAPVARIGTSVVKAARAFALGQLSDDICLIVARRVG